MKIAISNMYSNKMKEVKLGYSYTTLIFGFIPDLLRGFWLSVLFQIVMTSILLPTTLGVGNLIFFVVYSYYRNKLLLNNYLKQGYTVREHQRRYVESYLGRSVTY